MFDKSKCSECENIDCLTRCQWIDFDKESARQEIVKMINLVPTNEVALIGLFLK
jgi:hypothetical protein